MELLTGRAKELFDSLKTEIAITAQCNRNFTLEDNPISFLIQDEGDLEEAKLARLAWQEARQKLNDEFWERVDTAISNLVNNGCAHNSCYSESCEITNRTVCNDCGKMIDSY